VNLDQLTISVLFGNGVEHPEIKDALEKLPRLKVLGQTSDPQGFISQYKNMALDVALVEMNGDTQIPEWLEALPQELPHTHILVCSYNREPDFLIRAMQVGVREFLPLPLSKPDLEAALNRVCVTRKRTQTVSDQQGQIIVITSHKGGTGTTTLAINLAEALGELNSERIALLDLGRPFPDVGNFLDQDSDYSLVDLVHNISTLDQPFIQRIMQPYGARLSILHGTSDFREQDSLELESLGQIFTIMRHMYKFIVIDLSHWLDELFLKVMTDADMVLMLTALTIPDLRNLKKLWPYILEWHQERRKIRIVVNRYDNSSGLQLRDLENLLQHPVFATLPHDHSALMQCLNQGTPLSATAPRSKLWRRIKELVPQIGEELGEQEHGAVGDDAARKRFWIF
jgi:pilus assembly protein CpaE